MKVFGFLLLFCGVVISSFFIVSAIRSNYEWMNSIGSYWVLADKSSTLEAKSDYMNKFVEALEKSKLSGYNALYLKTPNNNFELNMIALKTLQKRLMDIKKMNPESFAYNQAIQQITAQEQGQADAMINVLCGVWYLNHYPLL